VPFGYQLLFQQPVIAYYPVVHNGKPPRAITMRVGVYLIRLAVSCPSGVTDAGRPLKAGDPLLQIPNLTGILINCYAVIGYRNAAGVIAPVLQLEQAVEQDGLGPPVADITNDTAHS